MRFEHNGMFLWYGTPDAPAPGELVLAASGGRAVGVTVTVGVRPVAPSNMVEVRYRVNSGAETKVRAWLARTDVRAQSQYFVARLPAFQLGDTVEYTAICCCAGRQVPSPEEAMKFASAFRVAGAEAAPQPPRASTGSPLSQPAAGLYSNGGAGASGRAIAPSLTAAPPPSQGPALAARARSDRKPQVLEAAPRVMAPQAVGRVVPHDSGTPLASPTSAQPREMQGPGAPVDTPPTPTLTELATATRLQLPPPLLPALAKSGIYTLADIRTAGGIGHLEGLPVAPDHPAVQTLEAHANLSTLSPDVQLNATLVAQGYTSTLAIAETLRTDFVAAMHDQIGDVKAAQVHVVARAQTDYLNNLLTGLRADQANGFVERAVGSSPTNGIPLPGPIQCECQDCEAAVSPLAYLADLLHYALTHLKLTRDSNTAASNVGATRSAISFMLPGGGISPGGSIGSGGQSGNVDIDLQSLTNMFHQPFGDLIASCEEMAKQVRQVRICIEILRSYLGSRPLADQAKEEALAGAEKCYRLDAYTALLNKIGTSYEELRLVRGDMNARQRLADRLGLDSGTSTLDYLDALLLDPAADAAQPKAITEQILEKRLGLVDTTRNPLSDGPISENPQGQIIRWSLNGVEWGRNTDSDGTIYVNLKHPSASVWQVELYRDRQRANANLVAYGERSTATGTVDVSEANASGLSGSFDINYTTDSSDIELSAIPNFLSWQLQHLRTRWMDEDQAGQVPIIDPGVINLADLRDATAGPAYDLWQARQRQIADKQTALRALKNDRERNNPGNRLTGLDAVLQDVLGVQSTQIDQQNLSPDALSYLLRVRELLTSNATVLDAEWDDVYSILIQVWKQKGLFAGWMSQERDQKLTLGPDYFQLPTSDMTIVSTSPCPDLSAQRVMWNARRDWQDILQSRIGQQKAVIEGWREAISTAEEATLLRLRDALILATDNTLGTDIEGKAKRLTQRLLIDTRISTCQMTTRIEQAIETLQGILFSARTGQLSKAVPLTLEADNFDDEWQWMGTYANWRAAMMVFSYPENTLFPSLRRWQTPAFREMVRRLRSNPSLTPQEACAEASAYSDYFQAVCSLKVQASCQAWTGISRDCLNKVMPSRYLFYMFALSADNKVYWSAYDQEDSSGYALSPWEAVPGLENVINIIGAAPYQSAPGQRSIYLFARTQGEGKQKLIFTTYDLERQAAWSGMEELDVAIQDKDEEGKDVDLDTTTFTAVLEQRSAEDRPPHLAVRVPRVREIRQHDNLIRDHRWGTVYHRSLNTEGSGWSGDWQPLKDFVIDLHAMVDSGKLLFGTERYFWLFFSEDNNTLGCELHGRRITVAHAGGATVQPEVSQPEVSHLRRLEEGIWIGAFLMWAQEPVVYAFFTSNGNTQYGALHYILEETPEGVAQPVMPVPLRNWTGTSGLSGLTIHSGSNWREYGHQIIAYQRLHDAGFESRMSRLIRNPADDNLSEDSQQSVLVAPLFGGPFDITTAPPTGRHSLIEGAFTTNERAGASDSILAYLEEAYYFTLIQLVLSLQAAGQYTAALDWFRLVYDYGARLDQRKIYAGLTREEHLPTSYSRTVSWLSDPLNPHTIAATRANTYTRFTLISLIRCFLDFADAEFTRGTAESINQARTLYMTALDLLDTDELRQSPDACKVLIAGLNVYMPDPPQLPAWNQFTRDLARITDLQVLMRVIGDVKDALASGGTWDARLGRARAVVARTKAGLPKPPRFATVLETRADMQARSHAALLTNLLIAEATSRAGIVTGQDFLHQMALVSGLPLAQLVTGKVDMPWLRQSTAPATLGTVLSSIQSPGQAAREALLITAPTAEGREFSRLVERIPAQPAPSTGGIPIPPIPPIGPLSAQPIPQPPLIGPLPAQLIPQPLPYVPAPFYHFCIPPNPVLQALGLHAELNLYKVRNCQNIAGMLLSTNGRLSPLQTTLPQPLETAVLQPTPYHYSAIIDRAKQLAGLAQQMEGALLSALEKRDTEAYNLLKARQDVDLTRAGVSLQELQVIEAEDGVTLAQLQRDRAQIQADHYQGLLNEGYSSLEEAELLGLESETALQYTSAAMGLSGSSGLLGWLFGTSQAGASFGLSQLAAAFGTTAQILSTRAGFERRAQDWELALQVAQQDIRISDQQIDIAQDHVRVTEQERVIAELQANHAEVIADFLANKFTSAELYDWMSNILEGVFRFFLQQATAMAKLAASQLAFERQEPAPPFIQADYWEAPTAGGLSSTTNGSASDRRGLTGSARLLQDIYQLDQYAFETNSRKLQLTKTISLAQLDPFAFQRFRETGVIRFATPMELFDQDFPGHYLRLIKRVRTSVIALIPPTQGIRATLSTTGTSRVIVGGDGFRPVAVQRGPESVALSSPLNATGLFELDQQPEMLLPFEGIGVDTSWEFRMPKAANLFDYQTIADVQITIEYTALNDFNYGQQVIQRLNRIISADRPFSFRNQFADQWYDLHNPEQTATPMTVRFTTSRADFPPNLDDLTIQQVVLYFSRADGEAFEIPVEQFHFTELLTGSRVPEEGKASDAESLDGVISTRRGNAPHWTSMTGKTPVGEWELALPNTEEMKSRFQNEQIEDILFVITYSGRTPSWPT
jgi:Tc toxin complex TcA C-terminal TcB-binding domain/ABC toxin N-terminal region